MAKNGQIPNALLASANSLFTKGRTTDNTANTDALKDLSGILEIMCEASFLEPTYQEIKDSGIKLTDEQYMFIFNYAQTGVRALEPFRKK